jgi:hypothetical protein
MTEKPANDPSAAHGRATFEADQANALNMPLNMNTSEAFPAHPKFNWNACIAAYLRRKQAREYKPEHVLDEA